MEGSTAVNNETNCHDESCNESLVTGGSPNKIENNNDLVIECSHNIKKDNENPVTESFSSNIKRDNDPSNVEIDIKTSVTENINENFVDNVIEDEGAVDEDVENVTTNDEVVVGGNVIPTVVAIDDEGADVFPMEIDNFLFRGSKFQESVPLLDQYVNELTELIRMDVAH
ncbi:9088_t:CDS:1 [Cetraspora pellucida]|uniref:9088_t:CDS:1 n=1 Tax=Cetraspora pellucida TaxID=1433469 RepID=A0A9N9CAR3_9GLOM|nr:9088_t:CDS:1 [Cetraspora pellucida]